MAVLHLVIVRLAALCVVGCSSAESVLHACRSPAVDDALAAAMREVLHTTHGFDLGLFSRVVIVCEGGGYDEGT